jgi:hypothetical protein
VELTYGRPETGLKSATPAPERPTLLLRRLSITCPVTGLTTDTGFELTDVPSVVSSRQLLIDCLECGQDHEWSIDDVMLDGFSASTADASVDAGHP